MQAAAIAQAHEHDIVLSGSWTALRLGDITSQATVISLPSKAAAVADASAIEALDTTGAWLLQKLLLRLQHNGSTISLRGLRPEFTRLMDAVTAQMGAQSAATHGADARPFPRLTHIGQHALNAIGQGIALLGFIGETTLAMAGCLRHPRRLRWRPVLYNIRSAGFDALPIVGVLSFLLGVVVAYQGSAQLRQYGANIFVADLVGLSMLREFAPLITAIIIAGRSGSAYAAQIGTMAVTEEIDAMRTLGLVPQEVLVLPKLIALVIALPLLTVFSDILGVWGGILMASTQLEVGFAEFIDRLTKTVSISSYLVGIGKAPIFALIIACIGCFQGFRTKGGADSVGQQTTRSVVQSIFLVIVADALLSIAFSALDL